MAHLVKCLYCGETFDADKEPFIKPRANRYAHEKCANGATAQQAAAANDIKKGLVVDSEKEAYNELKDYLNTLFKGKINWPLAISKMQALRLQNYTYSGMRKALQWWYEIKKNSPQDVKSPLGIIPYIYEDAYKYYEAIFLAEQRNKDFQYTERVREFTITPPAVVKQPPRLFNLEED